MDSIFCLHLINYEVPLYVVSETVLVHDLPVIFKADQMPL